MKLGKLTFLSKNLPSCRIERNLSTICTTLTPMVTSTIPTLMRSKNNLGLSIPPILKKKPDVRRGMHRSLEDMTLMVITKFLCKNISTTGAESLTKVSQNKSLIHASKQNYHQDLQSEYWNTMLRATAFQGDLSHPPPFVPLKFIFSCFLSIFHFLLSL